MKTVVQFFISVIILALIVFGILKLADLETGELMDWIIGMAIFLWLMVIVTVPWNAHFKAKEVLDDAEISKRKEILVVEDALAFTKRVARRSLVVAISLHIISAIGLVLVAPALNVQAIGYFGALAALLLTFLRPSVRFYEYINQKLSTIKQEFRYPREDMYELLNKVDDIQYRVESLEGELSDEPDKNSWKKEVNQLQQELLAQLNKHEGEFNDFKSTCTAEFDSVRHEQQEKLAKITSDSKVLDSVREIASFLKQIR
ncbi:MAG: hypothetical protein ACPGJS_12135 [Flammeovirgaceae bacterium]